MGLIEDIAKRLPFGGRKSVGPMTTAGTSGEDGFADSTGYIRSDERSYKLRGRQRYITYAELLNNTVIAAAGVRYFLNLVANAEWVFKPAEDENGEVLPGAQEAADFVKDCLTKMDSPWSKVVRRAARFRFHGFSWQEWTARRRPDGRIGFADIEPRPCGSIERWDLDEGNSVMGVIQVVAGKEAYLPRGKALYLVDDVLQDSPDGTGLLRHVVRSADRLKGFEDLEELAFETDLRGIPIGRAPLRELREANGKGEGATGYLTADQIRRARQAVDNFVKNRLLNKSKGAVFDSETYQGKTPDGGTTPSSVRKWDVELLKGESSGQEEVRKAIHDTNLDIARLLGVEHLMLGSDGTGSLALIGGKLSSFFLVVSSTLGEVAEAADRDLIPVLCSLNGIPEELWPSAVPSEIDVNDVEAVAQVLASLATAGAPLMPNDPAVDAVRARVGLPPAPEAPELSEEDMALVARTRAGLALPPSDKENEQDDEDKSVIEGDVARGQMSKLLKALTRPGRQRSK